MSGNCAFLTLEDRADFYIYDHLLVDPLANFGWSVVEIPWNRQDVDWGSFDTVIIRSTWDYQLAPEKFLATLDEIAAVTTLHNPVEICRWNINKRYLLDMRNRGIQIVPTHWLEGLNQESITSVFEATAANGLVAKPLVGANSDDTFVLRGDDPDSWSRAMGVFAQRDVMVQPFIDSILTEGEYSLFYFGGQLSHVIVKRPAKGDFRVQEEHGGRISSVIPAEDLIHAGNLAIQAIGQTLLYARVDLVRLESGIPALIELELIEPSLYFEQDRDAAERFAVQFDRLVSGNE